MKLVDKLFFFAVICVSFSFFYLRFNNYTSRFNFAMDQGFHLIESKSIIENKHLTLIGPSSSKTYQNRQFFTGPIYYYILAVLGTFTKWNPLSINSILICLDFISIIIFVLWLKKKFNPAISLTVFLIFTFSKYFIFHHTFFWNPHFILPLSIFALIFLDNFKNTGNKKWIYYFSFIFGLAISFHYTVILWIIPAFLIIFPKISKIKIKDYLIIFALFFLGDLPFYIFEIRHGFYNFKTAFLTLSEHQDLGLTSHYFIFPLIIFLIYFLAIFFNKAKKQIIFLVITLIIFIFFNSKLKIENPTFTYPDQQKAVQFITNDGCPINFNVSQTLSGDSRAYNLRFLLSRLNCHPDSINNYPISKIIYFISSDNRPFEKENIWEVTSGQKLTVEQKTKLSSNIDIYKLVRSSGL